MNSSTTKKLPFGYVVLGSGRTGGAAAAQRWARMQSGKGFVAYVDLASKKLNDSIALAVAAAARQSAGLIVLEELGERMASLVLTMNRLGLPVVARSSTSGLSYVLDQIRASDACLAAAAAGALLYGDTGDRLTEALRGAAPRPYGVEEVRDGCGELEVWIRTSVGAPLGVFHQTGECCKPSPSNYEHERLALRIAESRGLVPCKSLRRHFVWPLPAAEESR